MHTIINLMDRIWQHIIYKQDQTANAAIFKEIFETYTSKFHRNMSIQFKLSFWISLTMSFPTPKHTIIPFSKVDLY